MILLKRTLYIILAFCATVFGLALYDIYSTDPVKEIRRDFNLTDQQKARQIYKLKKHDFEVYARSNILKQCKNFEFDKINFKPSFKRFEPLHVKLYISGYCYTRQKYQCIFNYDPSTDETFGSCRH